MMELNAKPKVVGNRTYAIGTGSMLWGLGSMPQMEGMMDLPEPSNAIILLAIGALAVTLKMAIVKVGKK